MPPPGPEDATFPLKVEFSIVNVTEDRVDEW
jgi:hypothetical protein